MWNNARPRRLFLPTSPFARVGKLFQDLPVDQIAQATQGLNQAYSENLARYNQLELAMANLQAGQGDQHIKAEKIRNIQEQMQDFAQNGGFEKADAFVGALASRFAADPELQLIQENYKLQQEDEALARQLRAQGITPIDARSLYNGEGPFSSVSVDEFGNKTYNQYRSGYIKPGEYDKVMSSMFDQLKANAYTDYVQNPDGSVTQTTRMGISPDRIRKYADEAFKRYSGTDAYKTQLIDLETQGITGDQARAMIKDQLVAAGMEKVYSQNQGSLKGYINPNAGKKTSKTDIPGLGNRFIQQAGRINVSDPNGIWGMFGSKDTANIPTNGSSTQYVDNTPKVSAFESGQYYKVEAKNSDQGGKTLLPREETVMDQTVSHMDNVQVFVNADTGELYMQGKGAAGMGSNVPESEQVKMEDGMYYVNDKDGQKIFLKPRNMSRYVDEDGNHYFKPMDKIDEYRSFGADGSVNYQPIELGAPSDNQYLNGTRKIDNVDFNYMGQLGMEIMMDPQANQGASQAILYQLQNMRALDDQNIQNNLVEPLINKIQQGASPIAAATALFRERGLTTVTNDDGRDVQMTTPEGTQLARMLNGIFKSYEDSKIHKQIYKPETTGNVADYDPYTMNGVWDDE